MRVSQEAILLRIFVGEDDRYAGRLLYETIVEKALERNMAGATAIPAPEGFGRSRYMRTTLNVDAGPQSPVAVEIIDSEDQINRFLPLLHEMVKSGLITLEKVRAIRYQPQEGMAPHTNNNVLTDWSHRQRFAARAIGH